MTAQKIGLPEMRVTMETLTIKVLVNGQIVKSVTTFFQAMMAIHKHANLSRDQFPIFEDDPESDKKQRMRGYCDMMLNEHLSTDYHHLGMLFVDHDHMEVVGELIDSGLGHCPLRRE